MPRKYVLSEDAYRRTREAVRRHEEQPRSLVARDDDYIPQLQSRRQRLPLRLRVKEVFADYLRCRRWDGETEGDTDLLVAKPFKLRHDAGNYGDLSSLTTSTSQRVEVEDSEGNQETWHVVPAYQGSAATNDDEIYALRVKSTGVSVDDEDLTLIDLNVDGRAWAADIDLTVDLEPE